MHKEELLNLLATDARDVFDQARQLALARGGILSPLHLLVALLEALLPARRNTPTAASDLLTAARSALAERHPGPAQTITVPKETQRIIEESSKVNELGDKSPASAIDLLVATLSSQSVVSSLGMEFNASAILSELASGAQVKSIADTESASAKTSLSGALSDYCTDLAHESQQAGSPPFIGREREIVAVLETLCRKLKNNPMLIGKPGVGKSALVAAVALRLCESKVPNRLRGKRIVEVSRLRLLADARYSGDIEERLKRLLDEVRRAGDVILFFDEIHTLLTAGGAGGTGDVANLLKSSLSKGEITCIGATTLAEYYKYIARDEALARRFSTIIIEEPSPAEARRILSETRATFESYHGITIDDSVIALIVDLAERYLQSRCFPDKAFDLLDKAAAKATLAGHERLPRECVTETLSETTGLPLELMDEDPAERLQRLETFLNSMVPGQARASRDVARVVRIAKLGFEIRPEKPDGVFLFVGPEGVGKHEMAAALAKFLYGSTNKMIEFDMSQFTEVWSMSRLVGAEPGYVGYSERSGLLSRAAEDNPHSVLYFKNIDVAHPVVQQFLGEALEQGRFTDAAGARISLSNVTVVMSLSQIGEAAKPVHVGFTSSENLHERNSTGTLRISGSVQLRERGSGFGILETLASTIDEVIEFQVLDPEATERIVSEKIEALKARLESAQSVDICLDRDLVGFFTSKLSNERKSLAQLERLLQDSIVIPFTGLRLDRAASVRPRVRVAVENKAISVRVAADGDSIESRS
ncbi:MAG TPA: ATP-dependent Clp protease ATP-binding subunit [Blastocatellia bacterium]|nr:ATP-dependent Clp protease ATP-binding subunit [Blastocatellia bacterium]